MSDNLVMSAWAPGLIGLVFAGLLYGVTLGQSIYYARLFPNDSRFLKSLVLIVFLADTTHVIATAQFFWSVLIGCHRQYSRICQDKLPWGMVVMLVIHFNVIFAVQCFYYHRIWIISGKNKYLPSVILAVAILGIGFGISFCITSFRAGSISSVFSNVLMLPVAGLNAVGDFVITGSVFKYMWRSTFPRRQRSIIQDLAIIFINMGAFACTISIILGIVYFVQGHSYLVVAIGITISRVYVNSMLAVLNARGFLRSRTSESGPRMSAYSFEYEVPTA